MNEDQLRAVIEDFITELRSILAEIEETPQAAPVAGGLDKETLIELASHEAIVQEAYKDSKGIWTWGIGVTGASGHGVQRYKDNPQPLSKVIEIFEWLVRTKYLPAVKAAFTRPLTREQLAAALSFHYNTGAIGRATWVKSFNAGNDEKAKKEFMNWSNPPEIIGRRKKERDLFFEGKWSNNGTVLVIPVSKPSYQPNFKKAKAIDISKELS